MNASRPGTAFRAILALAMTAVLAAPATAAVIHVEPDGSGDYPTIQAAIDAATAGDTVELAPGTYTDLVTRNLEGSLCNSVAFLKSGIVLESTNGPDVTRIDGQGNRHCLVGELLDPATTVRGISFVYGYASGANGNGAWGGGVLVIDASPTFENNRFRACSALGGGGFLSRRGFGFANAGPVMTGNVFLDNTAGDLGGGLEISFVGSFLVEGNTFARNHAFNQGGAGLLINDSPGTVDRNIFWANTATGGAGGITCINGAGPFVSGGCNVFWENQSFDDPNVTGGGIVIGMDDNQIIDPQFCDSGADDFTLRSNSPCIPPGSGACGQIGALGIGCGPVSIEPTSWGTVKSFYR